MAKIKTILVDDELRGLGVLQHFANQEQQLETVASCMTAKDAIEKINTLEPHLVIMDIQLPQQNAFDILNVVDHTSFDVIFVTAYNQFAVKAFEYSTVDYLLKPVDEQLFKKSISKAIDRINKKEKSTSIDLLLHNIRQVQSPSDMKICITDHKGFTIIKLSEIVYCEADNCYTVFHLNNNTTITSSKTLSDTEELLDSTMFFRIHRTFLINIHNIKEFNRVDGGIIHMNNGKQLELSRRRKDDFMNKIKEVYRI
jgi:two-component system, LytTR family, response regulator